MRWRHIAPLVAALLSIVSTAPAMEFHAGPEAERTSFIVATGPIQLGDEARFIRMVGGLGRRVVLIVDSPGGNIAAADRMRGLISGLNMMVVVPSGATCASACFLLFAAARERIVERGARIGVHSASVAAGETESTMAITVEMARAVREYEIPPAILGRMVTTAPGEMAWLTDAEVDSIPRTTVLDAAQSQAAARPTPLPVPAAPPPVVRPTPAPEAAVNTPPSAPSGFSRGRADRQMMETWIGAQPANVRAGIDSWASRRSLSQPGDCSGKDPGFVEGCTEARRRLSAIDAQRRSDPEYRRGWNTR